MSITKTPNVGLQIPDFNTPNWQVPMNFNLNLLDQILSGNQPLTGFIIVEAVGFTPDIAEPTDAGLSRLAPGKIAVGNGTDGDASGTLQAAKFIGSGELLTKTLLVRLNGTDVAQVAKLNFSGGMQASLSGDVVTVQPTLAWQRFSITMSGSNWLVNGVNVGAKSSSDAYQSIPLFTTPAKQSFHGLVIKPTSAFTGTLEEQCTMTVGSSAAPDNLMLYAGDNYDLTQTVSDTNLYNAGGSRVISFAATSIVARVFVNGGSASVLTGGAVDIYLLTSLLP